MGLVLLLQTKILVIGGGFLGWLGAGFSFISSHMLAIFGSVASRHACQRAIPFTMANLFSSW